MLEWQEAREQERKRLGWIFKEKRMKTFLCKYIMWFV